jgi:hypothetical protein
MVNEVIFLINEEENGYLHVSWPHISGIDSKGKPQIETATLSYWKPTPEFKAEIMAAVFNEDFARLAQLWDVDEGSKGEDEWPPDFGEWSTKH